MAFPPHTVLALLKKAGNVHRSQLELETGPSESSPPSQSESAARLLPDFASLISEIFMRKLSGIFSGATTIVAPKGHIRINVLVSKANRVIFKLHIKAKRVKFKLHIKFIEVPDF